MICPICKTDISKPEQQFGSAKYPICQSDYLSGKSWIYDDDGIMELLKTMSLDDALNMMNKIRVDKMNAELSALCRQVT